MAVEVYRSGQRRGHRADEREKSIYEFYPLRAGRTIFMGYIIGIDLGGMSAKAAIFDGEGRILAKSNIATNSADGFDGTAKKLDGVARAVAREAKIEFSEVEAIGIASPGVVNSKTGVVLKWGN